VVDRRRAEIDGLQRVLLRERPGGGGARHQSALDEQLAEPLAAALLLGDAGTYAGTVEVSDDPVRVGSTYVDRTPIGRLRGKVLELDVDRRIVFRQATARGDLDVRITYELEPVAAGTRLVRTGEITTRGWLAIIHPVVVWMTRAENRRTMKSLKASLEAGA
jgi:hypothetical protein